jgi:hypothetical protein
MRLEWNGEDSIDLRPVPINIEKRLKAFWMNGIEMKAVHVRNYLQIIKNTVEGLAQKFKRPQADIERICLRYGTAYIYQQTGVAEIKRTRHYLINNFPDPDRLRNLQRFFDLGTMDVQQYTNRFPINDVAACNGLASELGLNKSIIFQMAIIGTLLHTDGIIHTRLYNQMAEILIRFRGKLIEWGKKAAEIENECRREVAACSFEQRIPMEYAVGDFPLVEMWDQENT